MTSQLSIDVQHLVKKFPSPDTKGELVAVNNISFTVARGEVFGLLGPNGAGKTTTLEIIEGLQEPTSGKTLINGLDTHQQRQEVKRIIGIQLQSSAYYEYLQLGEILELFGRFYGKKVNVDQLLDIVDLRDKKKALVKQLSGGQAQRFSICAALVNDPEIVFLDEPTTGLDPYARRLMWDFIKRVNQQGKTVVLTTHYMEEAETLCHRVGIMEGGIIAALDTPANLIRQLHSSSRIQFGVEGQIDLDSLKAISGVLGVKRNDHGVVTIQVTRGNEVLPSLYKWAEQKHVFMGDLQVISANLEDVFIEFTGKKLQE
ncbi:MAG: ABC transporter ATP-binding protein [Candidatus Kerfeldbacteria bacterium]|nr:ABC transporter ATP-binding protein [Candidatus Kerfeldbacteria bacterium]